MSDTEVEETPTDPERPSTNVEEEVKEEEEHENTPFHSRLRDKERGIDPNSLPEPYSSNTQEELLILDYVQNFKKQFTQLYPHRTTLFLSPKNECGVRVLSSPCSLFSLTSRNSSPPLLDPPNCPSNSCMIMQAVLSLWLIL